MPRREIYAYVAGIVLLLASLAARYFSLPVITDDYIYFLRPWFETLSANPGLSAFREPFSNYAPAYVYLLKVLTLFPVSSLLSIKTLSILFDLLLGFLAYLIIKLGRHPPLRRGELFLAFAVVFSLPTVILNSSMWGQSDAIYAAFVLGSLYFILRDRPFLAAAAYGLAISFKLQAIFFAPVLLGYFFHRRRGWLNLLAVPAVYLLSLVPAWLGGGNFGRLFLVYLYQTGEYQDLTLLAPSVFSFLNEAPVSTQVRDLLALAGMALGALAAAGLVYLFRRQSSLSGDRVILLALLSVLLLPFVLPRMHERYFYLADLLSVIYAFYFPRRWYVPVGVVTASLSAYAWYLSGPVPAFQSFTLDLRFSALLFFAVTLVLGYHLAHVVSLDRDHGRLGG